MQVGNLKKINQTGLTLILLAFILALVVTGYILYSQNSIQLKIAQKNKTNQALAMAKQALLAYSAEVITGAINGALLTCNNNCPRPGDLPCPDIDNDGSADPPCAATTAGRLPWKTMGLGDIRDGSGERLWYAVSNQYKNNPRILPLNSDSLGTISYRNNIGNMIYNATTRSGLAAVVISPGATLTRLDNVIQNRTAAFENVANNYLDIAIGEDNADFIDGTTNGFISGEIEIGNQKILNDTILPITSAEVNTVMETRVLTEVMQAILYNFCPGRANFKSRTCISLLGSGINDYLPDPAAITDNTCLGNGYITNSDCSSNAGISIGRIPIGGNTSPALNAGWENQNFNSILQGKSLNNWFQQNAWRELIFYAVAPACTQPTKNCTGVGYLTLNKSLTPGNNKRVILIAGGPALIGQVRLTLPNKMALSNYLEDESILPLDNTFLKYEHNVIRNDHFLSIP